MRHAVILAHPKRSSFSTSGAPGDWVEVTGMKMAGHTHLGGVLSSLSKEAARARLEAVEQSLRACFTASDRA